MPPSPRPPLHRRQILRAGAWSVPALTLVAAVPAASASTPPTPPPVGLIMTHFGAWNTTRYVNGHSLPGPPWWVNGYAVLTSLTGNTAVRLPWYGADPNLAVTSITFTITVTNASGMVAAKPTVVSGDGWTALSGTVATGANPVATYVFAWAGIIHAGSAPSQTSQLLFTLPADDTTDVTTLGWPKALTGIASSPSAATTSLSTSVGRP